MHYRRKYYLAIVLWLAAMTVISSPVSAQSMPDSTTVAQEKERLIPLDVLINDAAGGQWVLLERDGVLYAPKEAFMEWRLALSPDPPVVVYRDQKWIALDSLPGYAAKFNFTNQSVELTFSPRAFTATRLTKDIATHPVLTPTTPSAFLNYDVSYTDSSYQGAQGIRQFGALTELGLSAGIGVFTSSFVGQNLTNDSSTQPRSVHRLETVYTRDFLDSTTTLQLGDSSTRPSTWGRSVYFGGVQIGRNFALRPGFITQPIPVISGASSAPSTVELYVNDVLRQTSSVPSGPFTIDNYPLLTSSGTARVVVNDVLGRQTVIDQPFFTDTSLLEQGLTDWSAAIGAVRENLGIANADYGQRFASGLLRRGMSKLLTLEGQAEYGQTTRDVGLGIDYAMPFQALGKAAFSVSNDSDAGNGYEWLLGLENNGLHNNYTFQLQRASAGYRQIGLYMPFREQLSGSYSYTSDRYDTLGLGFARIDSYDSGLITTYSGNYTARIGIHDSLTFTASRVIGNSSGYSFVVSFLMPLDVRTNLSGNVTHIAGQTDAYVSASRNLTNDNGYGWRALAGTRAGQVYGEGGLYYQGDKGVLSSDVSASTTQQTMRLGALGGIVAMDGNLFMSRYLQDSYALVEVPGYANVGVGFQGSTLTHTDKNGMALLTQLQPYQRNSILLDPSELPISAELDSIEQSVVPAAHSGVKVVFPVRSGRGALIHIKLENGNDAPLGASIELLGDKEEFFVARRGEAFITGLKDNNTLRMKWNDTTCTFEVKLPPGDPNDIPRIGPVTCVAEPATNAKPAQDKGALP